MSDIALRVQGLGKQYRLGLQENANGGMYRYKSLRDSFGNLARRPWQTLTAGRGPMTNANSFWALKDIDFEVKKGEVVGIIGRNGAGKSTLLKILSRITKPTTGRVDLYGRVGSLLEVGTGFHPELSGRENIYLNGAILGMTRAEVRSKFDEIVAFSEVEKFLDMAVKQYSSGMYMRLAFAVAANLNSDILIVDEVLAVGDVEFQKKCLGKLKAVSQQSGRTVLFVSHNSHAVQRLCVRALLLAGGTLALDDRASETLKCYATLQAHSAPVAVIKEPRELIADGHIRSVYLESPSGRSISTVGLGSKWQVRVALVLKRAFANLVVGVGIVSIEGVPIQTAWSSPANLAAGETTYTFRQDRVVLAVGSYVIVVGLDEGHRTIQQFEAARFDVSGEEVEGEYQLTSGAGFVLNSMTVTSLVDRFAPDKYIGLTKTNQSDEEFGSSIP